MRPVECGKHSKRPTQKTRIEETQITSDGRVEGVTPDTVHYVEMEQVLLDQRNPHQATTHVNPGLVADNRSLRFMAQLHLAGRRLRGFLRPPDGAEISGHCTDGSWFTVGLHPDDDGLFPLVQGGPQRLWDTVESCHAVWQRLGEPTIERFGVTAYHDPALQYVWFDHPDSPYRWPLPL